MNVFKKAAAVMCLAAALSSGPAVAGLAPPLHTLSPAALQAGSIEMRVGGEYSLHEWNAFEASDTDRELYRFPDLTLTFGMSRNVELLVNFPWLWLRRNGESMENGTGDIKVTAIYNIIRETEDLPTCALVITTKLPDAHYGKGFGTDQTDFWFGGIFSKTFGNLVLLANLSMGILDQPGVSLPDQDDVLAYDFGIMYSLTDSLVFGCNLDGVGNSRFNNDRLFARGGMAFKTAFGTLDLRVGTGLNDKSGDLNVMAGFTTALEF